MKKIALLFIATALFTGIAAAQEPVKKSSCKQTSTEVKTSDKKSCGGCSGHKPCCGRPEEPAATSGSKSADRSSAARKKEQSLKGMATATATPETKKTEETAPTNEVK